MFQIPNKIKRLIIASNYITSNKLVNTGKLILSYALSFIKLHRANNRLPYFVSIEASNFCNLHCPECPVGIRKISTANKLTFDFTLYKKLIDELKPTLLHTILYFQGEPMLHNQLPEMIHYAHLSKIYTSTSTNGHFLSENTAKAIVLSGLDKLIISVDGSEQETYQSYRVGGNFQKVMNGIKEIVHWKTTLKSVTPLLEIQFLVLRTNEHQLKEMKQLSKELNVDKITFKTAQLYDFENGHELMPTKNKYSRYKKNKSGVYKIKNRLSNHCWRAWSGAVINVHGEVLPCCFDKSSEFSFGNIREHSFNDCWHKEKASDFRESILKNRKQFEMCRNCTNQ
jgi:radical SAM protein with 4Fe4S-binding SPASM domain